MKTINDSAGGDGVDVGADVDDNNDNGVYGDVGAVDDDNGDSVEGDSDGDGDGVDVGADVDANNDGVDLHLDHEVGRLAGLLPILLLLHSRHCSNYMLPSLFHLSKYFSRNHLQVVLSMATAHEKLLFTFKETVVKLSALDSRCLTRLCAKHSRETSLCAKHLTRLCAKHSRLASLCAKHAPTLRPALADKCKQNMRRWRRCAAIFPTSGLIQYSRKTGRY